MDQFFDDEMYLKFFENPKKIKELIIYYPKDKKYDQKSEEYIKKRNYVQPVKFLILIV